MTQLFDRIIELTIYSISPGGTAGAEFKINSKALDMSFDVTKTNGSENNKGEVQIYNLSDNTRELIKIAKPASVILKAGYGDFKNLNVCYIGDIEDVKVNRDGGDIITTLTLATSLVATRQFAISKSWSSKVTLTEVIETVSLLSGVTLKEPRRYREHTWQRGYTLSGNPLESLKSTVRNLGMEISVTDNEMDIIHPRDVYKTEVAIINSSTGLIGIPEAISNTDENENVDSSEKDSKDNPNELDPNKKSLIIDGYKITSLLNSSLTPNARVSLTSERVNANNSVLRVESVRHFGSNFGDEFYSEIECFEEEIK